MEPIPESAALIKELGTFYDGDLLTELMGKAAAVQVLVPDLVGLSVAVLEDGAAFTLVATDLDVAVLDAVQYLAGGPCVDSGLGEQVLEFDPSNADDERQWQHFAMATAARAVASTVTLPILDAGRVVGTVNLYAASSRAFGGLHREIAAVFDAWAPGAITNADLSFETRRTSENAPRVLKEAMRVETAVGMLMETDSIPAETARQLLEDAAQRAGVRLEELAEALLEVYRSADDA